MQSKKIHKKLVDICNGRFEKVYVISEADSPNSELSPNVNNELF